MTQENQSVFLAKLVLVAKNKHGRLMGFVNAEPAMISHALKDTGGRTVEEKLRISIAPKMISNPQWRKALGRLDLDYEVTMSYSLNMTTGDINVSNLKNITFKGFGGDNLRYFRKKTWAWFMDQASYMGYQLEARITNVNGRRRVTM